MAKRYSRQEFLDRLWREIKRGKPLVMTGAGNGIAAKFIERGGIDIIGVYNTGYFRMQGYGSLAGMLPMADANEMVYQMGKREILPQVKETPVIAGNAGGIPMQMPGELSNYLVNTVEECAEKIVSLLQNPDTRKSLGQKGKEVVTEKFLMPRLIRDELALIKSLIK